MDDVYTQRHRLLAAVLNLIAACHVAPSTDPDASPGADALTTPPQGSLARGDLVINEIAPRPVTAPDAPVGVDWIELLNRSDVAVDLCEYFITDSLDRLDHYSPLAGVMPPAPCEPLLLEPGAYLIVHADDQVGIPESGHTRFALGPADEVHIVTTSGTPQDGLVYLYPPEANSVRATLARFPEGEGLFHLALTPSAGRENPAPQEAP